MTEILILADDLSGAADCAIAWVAAGTETFVLVDAHAVCGNAAAVAVDVNSRAMSPQDAGRLMAAAAERLLGADTRIFYQKMDSTLRGHWAEELASTCRAAAKIQGRRPVVIVAPAFPAVGRTTVSGRALLEGVPLEETEVWVREGLAGPADLRALLARADLQGELATLDQIGTGSACLADFFERQRRAGADAIVCDARTEDDLDVIARASLLLPQVPLCVGSAGLMRALARVGQHRSATAPPPLPDPSSKPLLAVVGSASQVSREQFRALVQDRPVRPLTIAPSTLRQEAAPGRIGAYEREIAVALASGFDVAVTIDASEGIDLREGPHLSGALANLAAPHLPLVGGLVATGGETARAILLRAGVAALRMHSEVEPGVPLAVTLGGIAVPVVTKAGAFGGPRTLINCYDALRGAGAAAGAAVRG